MLRKDYDGYASILTDSYPEPGPLDMEEYMKANAQKSKPVWKPVTDDDVLSEYIKAFELILEKEGRGF